MEGEVYEEMGEVDDGPGHAGRASEEAENDEPREEDDEDVGGPHARVRKPFRVPIQIRRTHRRHVHLLRSISGIDLFSAARLKKLKLPNED